MHLTAFVPGTYSTPAAMRSLQSVRATGTTHVVIVPTWSMASPTASSVAPNDRVTTSRQDLLLIMAKTRSLGMQVVLKPHLDIADGSFRGNIAPASPPAWFASYTTMIREYADLAQQAGAETLVIGTELSSMSHYDQDWRNVIAAVRARFSGRLTFAANWVDGARLVGFWDALDYIGIDAYMPLTSGTNLDPGEAELAAAWTDRGYLADITRLQARWSKPVVFTELGYQSRLGAAHNPAGGSGEVSQGAQARAYSAAFEVWSKVPWFEGIWWWEWSAEGLNARVDDASFRPAGKQAEDVLRQFNGVPRRKAASR